MYFVAPETALHVRLTLPVETFPVPFTGVRRVGVAGAPLDDPQEVVVVLVRMRLAVLVKSTVAPELGALAGISPYIPSVFLKVL